MELTLNARELKVLKRVSTTPISIHNLAAVAFPGKGTAGITKGNSWTRNSLRKLVKHKLVTKTDRGTYALTKRGTAALASL